VKHDGTLILCYHRVAAGVEDPFGLCVSPENFAAHLEEIVRRREPSTFDDLSAPSRRSRVIVTFDDGYSDNLSNALPIAESKGVPITVFVTSGLLGGHRGYWWDRLAVLLRSRPSGTRDFSSRSRFGKSNLPLTPSRRVGPSGRSLLRMLVP
jgi:peptidoglycan/xylan/chitin deacetylase (PgdA/CDA1 family)